MNEEPTSAAINLADWIIPLEESAPASFMPDSNLPAVEVPTPDVLQFPTDMEAYPTEGHHPRLLRFGRVA